MRAISLWQPWATAIAVGVKRYETRHWAPPGTAFGQPLAIHAAKRWGPEERLFAAEEQMLGVLPEEIPLGAIVAICRLQGWDDAYEMHKTGKISPLEFRFGNYAPNRYAWILTDVVALPEPIPFKGAQGFFNVPDELLRHA